jgi:hypothetical protein
MPLINTSVPNLIQGVSQQPDATRFAGQCEEQVNALSSVADGLKKRPNTRHIARLLNTAINKRSFVHFINRSSAEKYVLIHDGIAVRAWNILTGEVATINGSAGGYVTQANWYLRTDDAAANIEALTVADSTFLLNKTYSVALNTQKTDALDKRAIIFIKQGDYKKDYFFSILIKPESVVGQNLVAATATVGIERYVHSYTQNSNSYFNGLYVNTTTYTTYRWRVSSVTVTSGGSNYIKAKVSFASSGLVYENAAYTALVGQVAPDAGKITAVIGAGTEGQYAGTGETLTVTDTPKTRLNTYVYGAVAPQITVTISAGSAFGVGNVTVAAATTSGSAENNNSQNANTNKIAQALGAYAVSNSSAVKTYFDVTVYGSLVVLAKKSTWQGDFSISTEDSLGNNGMKALYKNVGSVSDLPTTCENGFRIKVSGDPDIDQDDYYVRFETDNGAPIGLGSWIESEGFEIEKGFNNISMPRVLISNDYNSFLLGTIDFAERKAGDSDTNPNPSFVGATISNMFFFKNRLGFLSSDNVILSEAGLGVPNEFNKIQYNFYRNTVSTLLDSAPIDVSVSSERVTTLESAVGFQENLILFSKSGQFILKGGELLTTKTVSVSPATTFEYDEQVNPLPLGAYIYYPFRRGAYSGIREFTVNQATDNYDSNEITEHVPAYIPENIHLLKGTSSENIVAAVSSEELGAIYMYSYFWSNNQKVLSSWSKFELEGEIIGLDFIEADMYLVVVRENQTHLLTLPLNAGRVAADQYLSNPDANFENLNVLLDERFEARCVAGNTQLSVKISNNPNTWSGSSADMPYYTLNANPYRFITTEGLILNVTYSANVWRIVGSAPTTTLYGYLGRLYDMKYRFSHQLFKAGSSKEPTPSSASPLLLRNGSVFFDRTNSFSVTVANNGRDPVTTNYSSLTNPTSVTESNVSLGSGFFRYPIYSKAKNTKITIENNGPFDSKFNSAEFESIVQPRSSRYG